MASIIKKNINGVEYVFINSWRKNHSGFMHESELLKNGYSLGKNKIQYYNRTWECYTYQSVMKGLVFKLQESYKESFKTSWKDNHGIKRLTEEKRKIMMENLLNDSNYKELSALYTKL